MGLFNLVVTVGSYLAPTTTTSCYLNLLEAQEDTLCISHYLRLKEEEKIAAWKKKYFFLFNFIPKRVQE